MTRLLLQSQSDPAYHGKTLGKTKLGVNQWGCAAVSVANLFQVPLEDVLAIKGAFNSKGEIVWEVVAQALGGDYLGMKKLYGWQIAVTDHYRKTGYKTHFFDYNIDTGEIIDPLTFPGSIQMLSDRGYKVTGYRSFAGTKLEKAIQTMRLKQQQAKMENALPRFLGTMRGSSLQRGIKRIVDALAKLVG